MMFNMKVNIFLLLIAFVVFNTSLHNIPSKNCNL